jgi:hypothetical protein
MSEFETAAAPTIAARIATMQAQIAAACARAGRAPESVTLIAVSKTHPAEAIIEAARAGIRHFGENRVEEAAKIAQVNAAAPELTWHMIGHVQSRKAREVVEHYQWVHSVDSFKIAERYSRFAQERETTPDVLLEVNVSGEASKEGFMVNQWREDAAQRAAFLAEVRQIIALPYLHVRGLMTVAPIAEDAEAVRPVFAAVRGLQEALRAEINSVTWDTLSMGMTDDYQVAIEEGATHVRIGRAIFGERTVK